MRDSAIDASVVGARHALPLRVWLDRAAFGLLIAVGVGFAVEFRQPVLSIGGMALTNVEALMALTFAAWIGARVLAWQTPRVPAKMAAPILVWVAVLLLSTMFAPAHQRQALLFMGRTISGVLIGWAAYDLTQSERRARGLMFAMAGGGAIVAIMGLMEASQGSGILRWLLNFKAAPTQIGDVVRVSSTLGYATIAAMVLELTLPIMLALALTPDPAAALPASPTRSQKALAGERGGARHDGWVRAALGTAIIITLATLVLTLSRAGVLAMGASLAVVVVYGVMRRNPTLIWAGAITGAVLAVFVIGVMVWNPITALRLSTETEEMWYQAAYDAPESVEMRPREIIEVPVVVTNTSVRAWSASGEKPYMLSYHVLDADGESVSYDGARTYLPHDVLPNETITLQALIAAPEDAGTYRIEWDMLQDSVSWFSWKGTQIAETEVIVSGAAVEGQDISRTERPTEIRIVTPAPTRFELWGAALRMAGDYPLLGVGPDNFRWQYGAYAGLDEWNTDIHANNLYLEWLADSGILGLAAFLWVSGALIVSAIKGVWRSGDVLALGLLASLIAWYVHGVFDAFIEFTPTYVAFWLIAGLTLSRVSGTMGNADRV